MPATAGRVKMPANNRVSSSVALRTTDVWSKTIGYDPYAGANTDTLLLSALRTIIALHGTALLSFLSPCFLPRHPHSPSSRRGAGAGDGAKKEERASYEVT
jgi:cytochrome c biogenesis protein CcdA